LPSSTTWTLIENFSTGTIISSAYLNAPSQSSQTYSITNSSGPFWDVGVITFQPGQTLSIDGSSASASSATGSFAGATSIASGYAVSTSSSSGVLNPASAYVPPTAGSSDVIWIEILDSNLISQGPVQFVNLNAQLYYNAVGSWTITVPYTDALWNLIQAGDIFVNVNWRGLFSFGGKCESPGYQDSIPGAVGGSSGSGPFIVLNGGDWLGLIANRIAYPSPGVDWSAQTSAASDPVSNIPLETAIKHYVSNNMGPATTSARRNTLMDVAVSSARGANVSYTVKFGSGVDLNLLNVIRAMIAQAGTAMGVQITRNPSTHRLTFDVYIPRDLTGKAWFSEQLGNLTAVSFNIVDPTCTDALVQGSGTSFVQKTATVRTQWNIVEVYNDSSGETDINNLNSSASDSLLSGQAGPTMSVTAADIPFLTFGRDYGLGDKVSIEVRPGVVYTDIISGVALTADGSSSPVITIVPTIGQSSNSTATDQTAIGQLTERIRKLEKLLSTSM
jgi:hypothetical protein